MSSYSKKIEQLLIKNKIEYKKEIKFSDLISLKRKYLRFDFGLYKNKKLVCLIEVDGEQHFQWIKHFHKTIFDFKTAQEWDRRKNSYCLRKNIPLIRIPYWDCNSITINELLTSSQYRVKSKYHNDILKRGEIK